jgi:4'-phosphopantetheinyl transferase
VNHAPATAAAMGALPTCDRIDLWHGSLEHAQWAELEHFLSDEERRRAERFVFERDARRFVVSHAVLRTLLGRAAGISPYEVAFRAEHGVKPVLKASRDEPIHFSLSRSEELVMIGLASDPLGVDVEWLPKELDTEALAGLVLSPCEQEGLQRLTPADRKTAFLRCWTQKEAYLKATGQGLQSLPSAIEVWFGQGKGAGLKSIGGDSHAAARWFVDTVTPREGYIGAVAIHGSRRQVALAEFDTFSLLTKA